jgi:cytochrome c
MTRTRMTAALIAASAGATILQAAMAGPAQAQDADKGKQVFNMCYPCHSIGPGAANKVGPELNGLDGRHSGTAANYDYSDANKNSGIVWNEAAFKQYIKDPSAMIPGTKMPFAGIKDQQRIDDLWAYISRFDANGNVKK